MYCGTVESRKFKKRLGLNKLDVINSKEQTALGGIKDAFTGKNMQLNKVFSATDLIFIFMITKACNRSW